MLLECAEAKGTKLSLDEATSSLKSLLSQSLKTPYGVTNSQTRKSTDGLQISNTSNNNTS